MKTKHQLIMSARSGYSGGKTLNNTVPRRLFALGLSGILFISVCALLPSPAQAQCQRWDVSGQWELQLDNGVNWQVKLEQQSANLIGTGRVYLTDPSHSSVTKPQHAAVISGNITGNSFAMKITQDTAQYRDTAVYRFTGTIGTSGKWEGIITGSTSGATDNGVHWVSSRRMKCADANPPISKQKTDASRTSSAEAEESSSNDTDDQPGKHKKNKNKKKHHHHHDDDENQGND
jgi:hypothetical protein